MSTAESLSIKSRGHHPALQMAGQGTSLLTDFVAFHLLDRKWFSLSPLRNTLVIGLPWLPEMIWPMATLALH